MNENLLITKGQLLTIPDFKAQVIPIESNGWWGEHDEVWISQCGEPTLILYLCFYKVLADYADSKSDSNLRDWQVAIALHLLTASISCH